MWYTIPQTVLRDCVRYNRKEPKRLLMQYLISALEGILTFLSPCLLPMLPVYLTYFAGGGERTTRKTLANALGFVLGFTVVFTAMGALAGWLGSFLVRYQTWLNLIGGLIVAAFGLSYMGVFRLPAFHGGGRSAKAGDMGFFSAFVFGVIFSVGWTPCVGTFLGSALVLASQQGHVLEGMGMLVCYSLGLGIPFLLSALIIDKLKTAFGWIKAHYELVNRICGAMLVVVGILMSTGLLGRLLSWLQ